jgi:hypothetical protein
MGNTGSRRKHDAVPALGHVRFQREAGMPCINATISCFFLKELQAHHLSLDLKDTFFPQLLNLLQEVVQSGEVSTLMRASLQ